MSTTELPAAGGDPTDINTSETPDSHKTHETDQTDNAQAPDEPGADPVTTDEVVPLEPTDALGELIWADPAELVIGTNTRKDVRLDPHFVASIRNRGVQEPITVRRRDDGAVVVRKGQRRTLAALKVGRSRVRVLVQPDGDPASDDRQAQIDRIVDQLGENHHRAGISDQDEVAAHQELLDLGLSAAQIARQTRTRAERVRQTTRVASTQITAAAMTRYDLTLDQAAVGSPKIVEGSLCRVSGESSVLVVDR